MEDKFNIKEYWKYFEILSVQIVKVQLQNILPDKSSDIIEKTVPLTRDHGIDGYLEIVLNGKDIIVTVEAKLRSKGPLGLKEFASSLINYLINLSDIHFVVTNVEFSCDAKNVLTELNTKYTPKNINYIDGLQIQKVLSQKEKFIFDPETRSQMENLIAYIMVQKFSNDSVTGWNEVQIDKKITDATYIIPQNKHIEKELISLLNKTQCFMLIEGDVGVGKSYVIKRVLDALKDQYSIISIDLSSDWSNQILIVELIRNILHLDFSKVIELLNNEEKEEIKHELVECKNLPEDYLIALKQLLSFDITEQLHFNYLMRIFFKTILEKTQLSLLLYLYNGNKIEKQTSDFFLALLPEIADKIKVIMEVDIIPSMDGSDNEYTNFVNSIQQYSYNNLTVTTYCMSECKTEEAKQYVKRSLSVAYTDEFVNLICSRYGRNLMILTDVVDYINKNEITTQVEINKMPLILYGSFTESTLKRYIQKMSPMQKKVFLWGIVIASEMNGCLNYSFVENLENHFKLNDIVGLFLNTTLFEENNVGIAIKNTIYQKVLLEQLSVYEKHQAYDFMLRCKDAWNISILQGRYIECCLLLELMRNVSYNDINELIDILQKQSLNKQKRHLLYLSYLFYIEQENKEIESLDYLVRYLESILEEMKYCNAENSELLDKADVMCQNLINIKKDFVLSDLYKLQIRIYILYYNQQKSIFRFDLAEGYIDKGLLLEEQCDDIELIGKLYWCKGLCMKERGIKPGFLNVMLKGIQKYPDAMYLKICYLSNYASSNFKRDLSKSYKALKVGIALAQKYHYVDLESWLSNNKVLCDLTRKDFSDDVLERILNLRQFADRYELLSDVSRSYNYEAVWRWDRGELDKSLNCLEHAINIYNEEITDQQKFLFRVNKLLLLWKTENRIDAELLDIYDWLKNNHTTIASKLNNVSVITKENNYAALLSLYRISYITRKEWLLEKLKEWFQFQGFQDVEIGVNSNIVDRAFIVNGEIFILF